MQKSTRELTFRIVEQRMKGHVIKVFLENFREMRFYSLTSFKLRISMIIFIF